VAKKTSAVDAESIRVKLKHLNGKSSSIEASAVMTRDGFPIASVLAKDIDSDRLGAISASLLSLAEKTAADLDRGQLEQVLIHGTDGFILMVQVGRKRVLSVVSRSDSRLGMLLVETKRVAAQVAELLETP
jgi:uncharacterized protein